ncbi:heme-binding protein [Pelagibius sp.]|uniref:SOUL family heme-binding protein n=1 Tax=Pelagibius sp. TaxID=1931238 RepID=UPI002609D7CF|nr:heme-binding protein [Pelagibius sp.]
MRKAMKVLGFVVLGGVGLAAVAAGAWWYYTNNVEQPKYAVVTQDGAIEVRDYPALVVAEVLRRGDRGAAVRAGFSPLANYIFAKEREGQSIAMTAPVTQSREKIAMTAPVTQARTGEGDTWVVRFIMPSEYALEDLPLPASADVSLKPLPPARRAAIRFSGVATDALIAEQEARLLAWLEQQGLTPQGSPTYAYYNDPFTPGPLRRNEVMVELSTEG